MMLVRNRTDDAISIVRANWHSRRAGCGIELTASAP